MNQYESPRPNNSASYSISTCFNSMEVKLCIATLAIPHSPYLMVMMMTVLFCAAVIYCTINLYPFVGYTVVNYCHVTVCYFTIVHYAYNTMACAVHSLLFLCCCVPF